MARQVQPSQRNAKTLLENDVAIVRIRPLGEHLTERNLRPVEHGIAEPLEPLQRRFLDDRLGETTGHVYGLWNAP